MADKLDIVIQKDASSSSVVNNDGHLRTMVNEQGEITGTSQLQVPSSEDASSHPSASSTTEWLRSIEMNKPDETKRNSQLQRLRIPMVPRTFRDIVENRAYYDPLLVSIGPYHHGKSKLKEMEKLKVTMASEFVADSEKHIEVLYNKVANVAKDVRTYYAEDSIKQFDDNAFARMMFLDGCFILQFILCVLRKPDNLKMTRHEVALVKGDLFLLENQLPFEVLKSLMSLRFKEENEGKELISEFIGKIRALPPQPDSVRKRIEKFLHNQRGSCKKMIEKFLYNIIWRGAQTSEKSSQGGDYLGAGHLLELLRFQFIEEPETETETVYRSLLENEWYRYHPATELRRVGIHFEPSRTNHFWDVMKFKPTPFGGTLKLPPITIDESTKSKFLNLVAYESCYTASNEQGVTSYVCFMDSLIDNDEDVRELRSKGIILNFLGSDEEVAKLFNGIANNLVPNPKAYAKVKKDIESHYKNFFKLWMIRHKDDISTTTLRYASLFGVIITALKTVFPMQSTCITDLKFLTTNFTRIP